MTLGKMMINLMGILQSQHIRSAQWAVLVGLKEHPGVTAHDLARVTRYEHSTVVHMLQCLAHRHELAYCVGGRPLKWYLNKQGNELVDWVIARLVADEPEIIAMLFESPDWGKRSLDFLKGGKTAKNYIQKNVEQKNVEQLELF